MNRLNKILFASTLVPAMAFTPFAGAFAQAPSKEHKGPGAASKATHPAMEHGGGAEHAGAAKAEPPGATRNASEHMAPAGAAAGHKAAEAPARATAHQPAGTAERTPATPHEEQPRHAMETGAAPRMPHAAETRTSPSAVEPTRHEAAEPTRHEAAEPTRHEAAEPGARSRQTGASDRMERAGTSDANPAAATAAIGAAHPGSAARDERRGTPVGAAQNQRPADANAAAQDQRRAAARDAADRNAPGTPMQNGRGDEAGRVPPNEAARVGERDRRGVSPGGVAAGVAAGFAGGFIAATAAQRIDEIRRDRREVVEDGHTYIREPGRTIVEDGDRSFVVHDENDRFRDLGYDVHRERHGRDFVDVVDRPGGVQIVTYTDAEGRMLRRVRRDRDGHEFVLIDNGVDGRIRPYHDDVVELPPPPMRLSQERYAVDYGTADEGMIYDTLVAPPLAPPPRRYTLDQIRYSPDVRRYVRSVDINTINFDSGSWIVPGTATGKLQALATAVKRAVGKNPNAVFLVEGYTDATGNATDNLSLSDRRAQSVATILTKDFDVPPENLTTQGYGQQNPKVDTSGPSAENRRVVVQNITPLLAAGNQPAPQE